MALVRRFPRHWWAPAALIVVAYGVVTIWLYPILIDPVFNRFDRLPPGKLRSEVLHLADRAGVDVGQVYRVDASRRTSAANAYVIGIGHSKRVVLYDNLIHDFSAGEVRTVVAHELGHQKHDDLLRGLAWLAIVAPAGTFLVQVLSQRFAGGSGSVRRRRCPRSRSRSRSSASAWAAPRTCCRGGWRRAPTRSRSGSRTTRRTSSASSAASRSRTWATRTRRGWYHDLFGTHPTTLERIGAGVAVESK